MIIPDVNLLIYAHDSTSSFHRKAAQWWMDCLSGAEAVGLPQIVIFGFVRVATNPRVFLHPMTPVEAADHVRSWLARPVAQILDPGPDHVDRTLKLLEGVGTAGNLVTDAQLASLAIEYRAVVHTADADFVRFPEVRWFNPLSRMVSRSLGKAR